MKLATFNVNGIGIRLAQLLAWLEREQPDIVTLQELKAADASSQPRCNGRANLTGRKRPEAVPERVTCTPTSAPDAIA